MQYKIWEITSYNDYVTNWPFGSRLKKLSSYFTKLGYETGEEFFNKNAYLAQELANQRVGGIIDTIFKTTNLDLNIQKYLKQFTYLAIDHLLDNDIQISENVRNNQTSLNNGRTDSTTITLTSIEQTVGTMAWRAFNASTIQILYKSYCENEGISFLLNPKMFYDKNEIDAIIKEQDDYIINQMPDILKEYVKNDKNFIDELSNKIDTNLQKQINNLQTQVTHLNNTNLWDILSKRKFRQYGFSLGTKFIPNSLDLTRSFI